ncbi:glypican-2-like isoform X2 [Physeter macrocephalus]|nr:glypican-2-like isoform X2 [Physeter catodon]|eukprot:XP_028354276.1 glypican-2-like isoform X2 [Physeter catodon]
MLSSAEHSLSLLFHRSFGRLYAQHTPLFSGLFSRLRDYYERSGEGLDDALVDFWAQLLEKMFPLLHPQYIFSPDYLFCLTRLASSADDSLKPFGDSPRRLRLQITRALVAARAFIQGLETGRDVVSETLKMPLSEGCKRAVMRLTGCPLCRGVPSLPPCRGFCLNVAHGCIGSQGLDPDWGAYLDGLLFLAEKIQGPFSFELAAQSIGVKIAEGLMHLQENSVGLSAQVFQECGSPQPAPARARRAPAPREEVGRLWSAAAAEEERPTTAAGASLPRLVWELRERLGRVRGFWAGLPLTVCGDPRVAADLSQEAAPCWTGAGRGRPGPAWTSITGEGCPGVRRVRGPSPPPPLCWVWGGVEGGCREGREGTFWVNGWGPKSRRFPLVGWVGRGCSQYLFFHLVSGEEGLGVFI